MRSAAASADLSTPETSDALVLFGATGDLAHKKIYPAFHGGFGLLNLHGIAKPLYRAYEFLHRLGGQQLAGVSALKQEPLPWRFEDNGIHLELSLPPHGLAAIRVELAAVKVRP